jgi:hypothetical protein
VNLFLFGFESGGTFRGSERSEEVFHVAVEHGVEVVCLESDAVIGDPVFRPVVGADSFGSVEGADLGGSALGGFGFGLFFR